ncbi:MAG: hypothetical protein IT371_30615 [Deltaproteobacteria bacterium]|nr:hypothetical protein [Deltaproteobacteria bacterium]
MSQYPNTYYQQGLATPGRASVWPSPIFPQADIPALIQDPCSGTVFLNPVKGDVDSYYMSNVPHPTGITAPFGTQQCSLTPPLLQGNQGDMEIVKLMSVSTGRFSALITDTWTNRQYMNKPVSSNMVFGTSQLPFGLYETIFLPATTSLAVQVTDMSGAPNDVRIVAHGRRFMGNCGGKAALQSPFMSRRTHPYWLTFDRGAEVTVDAGAVNAQFTMTVPSSADFLCWLVMDDSTVSAEDAITVRILEGTSGQILMDRALSLRQFVASPTVPVAGFPGGVVRSTAFPFAWTFTHLFKRATQVIVEVTNSAGVPQTLRMAFHGQLIYYGDCPSMPDPERMRLLQQPYMPMPAPPNWLPCAPGAAPSSVMSPAPVMAAPTGPVPAAGMATPYRSPAGEFGGPVGWRGGDIAYGRLPGT